MNLTTASASYWLARDVYFCRTQKGIIFLDLKKDRYLGLGGAHVGGLSKVVHGWSKWALEEPQSVTEEQAEAVAKRLLAEGLLTRDAVAGKSAIPTWLPDIDMQR